MSSRLRREDGYVFLAVYFARSTAYHRPINDSFFVAHNARSKGSVYHADHEAAALGYFEQFKYCTPHDGYCTPWTGISGIGDSRCRLLMKLLEEGDETSAIEAFLHLRRQLRAMSVISYLDFRNFFAASVPTSLAISGLRDSLAGALQYNLHHYNSKSQWEAEVRI